MKEIENVVVDDWLFPFVRAIGSVTPAGAALAAFQTELTIREFRQRLAALEDPISAMHPDIPAVCEQIYEELRVQNHNRIEFGREFYQRFGRAFACLDTAGMVNPQRVIGQDWPRAFYLADPVFILYMARRFEDGRTMKALVTRVDQCPAGASLRGEEIARDSAVPLPVVRAVFDVYEAKGWGECSGESGTNNYRAKV